MTIEWGHLINEHLSKRREYSFNAEHWGAKLLAINWNYILELWKLRNSDVHGDTPEKTETIRRTTMIVEILHIQTSLNFLAMLDRQLISRDETSLREMSTTSISSYLYGARMLAESTSDEDRQQGMQLIRNCFQPRQRSTKNPDPTPTSQETSTTI
jgi:hypothetical protein